MIESFITAYLGPIVFYSWLLAGTLFLFVELAMPGFLGFVSCSFGCFAGALGAHYGVAPLWQCWLALAVAAVSFLLLGALARGKKRTSLYQTNAHSLIGHEAIVTETVAKDHPGRVKVKGEEWVAITKGHSILEPSRKVRITGLDSNILIVG